ncbi:hypothetical protein B0H16DRAFT_1448410 [Mycena metata]|uniref:Uncharacterized protein n=1 Tax=Mycena metata TaxID=1033252 RepID=A0AAD7KC28_9AGAR|nr:hypothetical protein B0H16DRAFT_1448410 [Mycena metata]
MCQTPDEHEYEDMPALLDVADSDDERDIVNIKQSFKKSSSSTFAQNSEVVAGVVRADATEFVAAQVHVDSFPGLSSLGNVRVEQLWDLVYLVVDVVDVPIM